MYHFFVFLNNFFRINGLIAPCRSNSVLSPNNLINNPGPAFGVTASPGISFPHFFSGGKDAHVCIFSCRFSLSCDKFMFTLVCNFVNKLIELFYLKFD